MKHQQIVFDQYSRYRACGELAKVAFGSNAPTVLDVGSGSLCLLGTFLPSADITYLDPLISQEDDSHIAGTISCSALSERQFKLVASVDTFEHIERKDRRKFLERLSSCASECIILGFPSIDGTNASAVDTSVAEVYADIFPGQHEWLREHQEFGLPSTSETVSELQRLGWHCATIGHGHAPWLQQFLSAILPAWEVQALKEEVFELSEALNEVLFPFEFDAPSYRTFILATKETHNPVVSIPTAFSKAEADAFLAEMIEEFKKNCLHKCIKICNQRDDTSHSIALLNAQIEELQRELVMLQDSWSWKLTKLLRVFKSR